MKALYLPLLLMLAGPVHAQTQSLPSFEQCKAIEIYSGKPAAPQIKTARDRQFRTRIREGAAKGPNFAGHYTIASWGCGSGCVSMVIIDARTGSVYHGPFGILGWGSPVYQYEGKYGANGDDFEPLSYKLDSRLLIVRGCPEENDCASYFHEWTGTRFKLLRKLKAVRVTPDPSF